MERIHCTLEIWHIDLTLVRPDRDVLDPSDVVRAMRLRNPRDQQRSLAAWTATRRILAASVGCQPRALEIRRGSHGRPDLVHSPWSFSLSHSGDNLCLAVSRGGTVGIDIEQMQEIPDMLPVADTICTAQERLLFRQNPCQNLFYRTWTRKEAVCKAIGIGLSLNPAEIEVMGLADGCRVQVPGHGSWHLWDIASPQGIIASCATSHVPDRVVLRKAPSQCSHAA